MTGKELIPMNLEDTLSLGKVLSESGFFTDTRAASQAVVKVLAGRELGFGPIASMTGIHIVQGKPSIGANLMGAAIKGSGKYNYRVVTLTDQEAEIAFYEGKEEVGRSKFTIEDAKRAGLTGKDTWQKYPKNLLFARALSNGARWYCPDIFGGVTPYTPEELGATVDSDGDVIDLTPVTVQRRAEPARTMNGHTRPLDADALRQVIRKKSGWKGDTRVLDGEPATEKQVPTVAMQMNGLFPNLAPDVAHKARHDALAYLLSVASTKDLTKREASALLDWVQDQDTARIEAARILEAIALDAGQQKLEL